MSLAGKTIFMSGGSRGIGLAIALRAAREGANVVVAAKTDQPHPKLEGTIHTAAQDIEKAGGKALAVVCDIRSEEGVAEAVDKAVERFGGLDICINNASAIQLTGTLQTDMKRYDLMHGVNTRGTFLVSKTCLPHLKASAKEKGVAHILNLAPPLDMEPKWFGPHVAYTMAKYGMSMCTLGMSAEFRRDNVAVNSLWPLTAIDTAAVRNVLGGEGMAAMSRSPEIMADAAHIVLSRGADFTGNFVIDEALLREEGVSDFSKYQDPKADALAADFFVPDEVFDALPTKVIRAYD